ncbi:hypothetical protein BD289DRAFT_11791 [Coniella lustricola]|uniref:Uncharacterized protein n=1 Tax=Coniella lustricola TaxID=2025994 RepID=A0A2T3A499_9PEZI|nr:hypothetical protein BD289DRAFT_11791 [Coniella lustricola]
MKPSTPRRGRRQGHSANQTANAIPVSDYESDGPQASSDPQYRQTTVTVTATATATTTVQTANYADAHSVHGGLRSIGDMNLGVIRRYEPTVQSYIAMSHNVLIFKWDEDKEDWGEEAYKGPLFICNQEPDVSTGAPLPRACLFLVNRGSLENFILDLSTVLDCRQNESQKALLELTAVTPTGYVNWGLLVREPESLDETWAAMHERWRTVQRTTA